MFVQFFYFCTCASPVCNVTFFFYVEGALFFCLIPCDCSGVTSGLFTHRQHGLSLPFLHAFGCSWHPSRSGKWGFPAWEHRTGKSQPPFCTEFPSTLAAELRTRSPWLLKQSKTAAVMVAAQLVHDTGGLRAFVPFQRLSWPVEMPSHGSLVKHHGILLCWFSCADIVGFCRQCVCAVRGSDPPGTAELCWAGSWGWDGALEGCTL